MPVNALSSHPALDSVSQDGRGRDRKKTAPRDAPSSARRVLGQGGQLAGLPGAPSHVDAKLFGVRDERSSGHVHHEPKGLITRAVQRLQIPQNKQNSNGLELQPLNLNGSTVGVMTRYPQSTEEIAQMFRMALKSRQPRITSLMNDGDAGESRSYIRQLHEGVPTRVGELTVIRGTSSRHTLGRDASGVRITATRTSLQVLDEARPQDGWREVEHQHINHWKDRTSPPLDTFDAICKELYRPGQINEGVIHCFKGFGRTLTVMIRLAFEHYLHAANLRGVRISPKAATAFMTYMVNEARRVRGDVVMPDEHQRRLLLESMLRAVRHQHVQHAPPAHRPPPVRV